MKSILLAAFVAIPASLLATGCPLVPGCSAYQGASDMVYQRGNDMLVVCSNGGYSATLGTATQEGFSSGSELTDGTTGAIISDMATQPDAGVTAFGATEWTYVALDQTALNHADALCQTLETRAWWNATALPVDTSFARPALGFQSVDDCISAQTAGTYPTTSQCQDQLDLCADGSSFLTLASGTITGSYTANDGVLAISQFVGVSASASFRSDGSLTMAEQGDWSTKTVSPQAVSKCSK